MAESDEQQRQAEQAKRAIKGGMKERQGKFQKKLGQATGSAKTEARGYLREARGRLEQDKTTQSSKRTSDEVRDELSKESADYEEADTI